MQSRWQIIPDTWFGNCKTLDLHLLLNEDNDGQC